MPARYPGRGRREARYGRAAAALGPRGAPNVNGRLAGARRQSGALIASAQPLRFGGNAVCPEWFAGRLDEVRVYDRALTADQLTTDMRTPIHGATAGSRAGAPTGAVVKRYRGRRPHAR